jgi:predicted nucleotidyltransferase
VKQSACWSFVGALPEQRYDAHHGDLVRASRDDYRRRRCDAALRPSSLDQGRPAVSLSITVDHERIVEFCGRNRVRRLSFFGSVLRADFGPASDVDVLVEFEPEATVGYFSMSSMEQELTEMFGRRVDLRTPNELSRYFRAQVLADAQEEYVA